MRRLVALTAVMLAALAALASPAWATFHLNTVNEVMLASQSGDPGVQFVEFLDRGGTEEQFTPVFAPYKLVIYDPAGNKLGEQTLNPNGLRSAAAAGREYLVSTAAADAAFGVTGDEPLTVTLPPAGQACFEANPTPPAFSCLTWGAIVKPVQTNSMGTGSVHGPVPPNGESDQRQPDGTVVAAAPTPKAPNRGASGGTAFAGVKLKARSAPVRHGKARVSLVCPAGSGGCSGQISLGKALGSATFRIADGATATVAVPLSRAARRRLRHGRIKTTAVIVARDGAGDSKRTAQKLTLTRGR